jgi:23S rRNA (uracil1939-C5)-methyltransferase
VDTVLVDPPREGLDARHLALAAGARRRLVYVSCDPQTLARDAARLQAQGWRLEGARAFDLMPQTHHVEVVAWFARDVGAAAT